MLHLIVLLAATSTAAPKRAPLPRPVVARIVIPADSTGTTAQLWDSAESAQACAKAQFEMTVQGAAVRYARMLRERGGPYSDKEREALSDASSTIDTAVCDAGLIGLLTPGTAAVLPENTCGERLTRVLVTSGKLDGKSGCVLNGFIER